MAGEEGGASEGEWRGKERGMGVVYQGLSLWRYRFLVSDLPQTGHVDYKAIALRSETITLL